MIYDIRSNTCIITPPKCGTTILHHVLCKLPKYWYVVGPAKWDSTTKHCSAKDIHTNEIKIKRWVLLMRHPIDRMVSMWKHRRSYDGYDGTLSDFVNHHNLSAGWYAPCTSYADKIDAIIHQETIFEDCKSILNQQFDELLAEKANVSKFSYDPTEEEYGILCQAANTIYYDDLRVGGYEIRPYKA